MVAIDLAAAATVMVVATETAMTATAMTETMTTTMMTMMKWKI
jgi:hypothetical protein